MNEGRCRLPHSLVSPLPVNTPRPFAPGKGRTRRGRRQAPRARNGAPLGRRAKKPAAAHGTHGHRAPALQEPQQKTCSGCVDHVPSPQPRSSTTHAPPPVAASANHRAPPATCKHVRMEWTPRAAHAHAAQVLTWLAHPPPPPSHQPPASCRSGSAGPQSGGLPGEAPLASWPCHHHARVEGGISAEVARFPPCPSPTPPHPPTAASHYISACHLDARRRCGRLAPRCYLST
jgi:hypothetical protein